MNRPYIICHMVTSLDGKVTGDFLATEGCAVATEIYYDINRNLKSDGFICGRVTMEGSFTGGFYPDLEGLSEEKIADFIPNTLSGFYAVAFDTNGKLGWKSEKIEDADGDPGYDGAQIIEVLSEAVDGRYLSYLKSKNIAYIFAGKEKIDIDAALCKLKEKFNINTLLLEGGSIINGSFLEAGAVDKLSLVIAPMIANKDDKPLFFGSSTADFTLLSSKEENGVVVLNYKKNESYAAET